MEVRRVELLGLREIYELGSTIRIPQKAGHYRTYRIEEIREIHNTVHGVDFRGYQLWGRPADESEQIIQLGWIPYHATQAHFYEVEGS